ncbi:MAG TPA: MmcQ/YjbR family DNA-binding protein [Candidatus Sulfotelmatobacter sp.]|nr:MmcQ/YjbR family DNA-binding protein [Candidatus Sulfotelmatobacter sp.]
MNIEQLRKICIAFPGATEQIQWEDDLVFKVGGKMFAVAPLEPARVWLTIKADPEAFVELTERPGIIPAPYLARAKWISIESPEALSQTEVTALLRKSYELISAKLPTAKRQSLSPHAKKRISIQRKPRKRKKRGRSSQ